VVAVARGPQKTAIRDDNPVLFLEQKALYTLQGAVPDGDYTVPLGAANVVRRGDDVTLVTLGAFLQEALKAVDRLEAEGIGVEVIDLRTLKPIDMETIYGSLKKTNRVIVAHEAVKGFGAGAEVAAAIAEEAIEYLAAPIQRVGAPDVPMPFNNAEEARVLPQASMVEEKIKRLVQDYPK
jgi:pyruvate dehydrogenase E1 component beta subunit